MDKTLANKTLSISTWLTVSPYLGFLLCTKIVAFLIRAALANETEAARARTCCKRNNYRATSTTIAH